jgi:hypothetical protein
VAEFPSAEVLNTLGWGTKTGPNISGFNARQIQFGAGYTYLMPVQPLHAVSQVQVPSKARVPVA